MALSNEQWNAPAGGGFYTHQIANSVRFSGDAELADSRSGDGSTTKGTFSMWFKRSTLSDGSNDIFLMHAREDGNNHIRVLLKHDDTIEVMGETGAAVIIELETTRVFRDTSAWYHLVVLIDFTDSTAGDRCQLYINGVRETAFDVENYPDDASQVTALNTAATMFIGTNTGNGQQFKGYLAEVVVIDGTRQAIGDLGEFKNGVWIPKDPSGLTFGTNGFYLKFAASDGMGTDSSGNGHTFGLTNIAASDQMLDSPTFNSDSNGGNFCTINPSYKGSVLTAGTLGTITEGNLKHSYTNAQDASCPCTIKVPPSGKWYFEWAVIAGGGSASYSPSMGIIDPNVYTMADPGTNTPGLIAYTNYANKVRKNGTYVTTYGGSRASNGDVMGIAVDMDNGAFYVSKNGTYFADGNSTTGDPTSGSSKTGAGATWTPASEYTSGMVPISQVNGGNAGEININFGQDGTFQGTETAGGNSDANGLGNFFTAPPTDYLAICSSNLSAAGADPAEEKQPVNNYFQADNF
mgnify:CR=1 FL=1